MPKKKSNNKIILANTSQTNISLVKANEKLLQEEVQSLITSEKDNLLTIAINSKDTRILELFTKNGGKLTAVEASEFFEYIAANDRVDILKYFIETLKLDFSKPLEKLNPISLLHFSAMYGAKNCITYLLDKKYDINKLDGGNYTPLEYAILSKHTEIAKLFIQKGAKIGLEVVHSLVQTYEHKEATKLLDTIPSVSTRLNGYGLYEQIRKNTNKNDVTNNTEQHYAEFSQKLASILEDAKPRDNYYKLILGREYHLLSKVIEEQQKFIDNKILQLNLIENKAIIANIMSVISEATNIHKIFKFNDKERLENYIIEILETNKNLSKQFSYKLLFFCSDLMAEAFKIKEDIKSVKYAKIIEENSSVIESLTLENQAVIFKNLGFVYSSFDPSKALSYLSKAEILEPSNSITERKYTIYRDVLKNLEAAIIEAEKITDNELKALLIIHAHKKLLTSQDISISVFNDILLQHNFAKLSPNKFKNDTLKSYVYYDIQAQQYINAGQYQLANNIYDKLLNQAAANNNNVWFCEIVHSYLLSFYQKQDWSNGCKFLDKIYQKYSTILNAHNILRLKALEFTFYAQEYTFYSKNIQYLAKSDKILENIKPEAVSDINWIKFISTAYRGILYNIYLDQNIQKKLPIYLKNIEKLYNYALNKTELPLETVKQLSFLLQQGTVIQNTLNYQAASNDVNFEEVVKKEEQTEEKAKVVTEAAEPNISDIILQEPFVKSLPKESKISFKEIENLLNAGDYITLAQNQKQLENYFRYKKVELQKQQMQEAFGIKSPIFWYTKKGNFTSTSEDVVKINEEKNLYAVIAPKLIGKLKLDKITVDKFIKALKKGEAARSEGVDGVKFISNCLIELKISEDSRLYTNKLYVNGDDKLIIFEKEGNHEAVSKAASECIIQNINVSANNDLNIIGEYYE